MAFELEGKQGDQFGLEEVVGAPGGKSLLVLEQLQHQDIRQRDHLNPKGGAHLFAGGGPQEGGQAHQLTGAQLGDRAQAPVRARQQPGLTRHDQQQLAGDQRTATEQLARSIAALAAGLLQAPQAGG